MKAGVSASTGASKTQRPAGTVAVATGIESEIEQLSPSGSSPKSDPASADQ